MDPRVWFVIGALGFSLILFGLFFGLFVSQMVRLRRKQQQIRAEERLLKEQNQTALELAKLERDLTKRKMIHSAETEMNKSVPKYCQYCGGKISAGSIGCLFCGASLQRE